MKIVITGGSRGIGKMLVERLHKEHTVVVLSKQQDTVEGIAEEFPVEGFVCDVSDYDAVKKTFSEIGEIDALINCAGIVGPVGVLLDTCMTEWKKTLEVNLMGTAYTCKTALKKCLSKSGKMKIINFSGGGSAFPRLYNSAYATSKAAVVRFTENLAIDLSYKKMDVDVNVIAPGAHNTGMWKDETFEQPPAEWADPQLVFDLVDFLLSKQSDGISGKFFHIKDNYKSLDKTISESDLFTLRRIDDFMFTKLKK